MMFLCLTKRQLLSQVVSATEKRVIFTCLHVRTVTRSCTLQHINQTWDQLLDGKIQQWLCQCPQLQHVHVHRKLHASFWFERRQSKNAQYYLSLQSLKTASCIKKKKGEGAYDEHFLILKMTHFLFLWNLIQDQFLPYSNAHHEYSQYTITVLDLDKINTKLKLTESLQNNQVYVNIFKDVLKML